MTVYNVNFQVPMIWDKAEDAMTELKTTIMKWIMSIDIVANLGDHEKDWMPEETEWSCNQLRGLKDTLLYVDRQLKALMEESAEESTSSINWQIGGFHGPDFTDTDLGAET